ncbi:acetyl-CoA carboxylase, biotin carboxyl carrier protein [Microbispora sp. RL4-1S]|uniref:Biotin carboxyl carrier protein of acetyl-CoA carboxylase n=1 Tax=Microbispora oryzae TaxID=2806554 RepID=A0A941AL71_9ACTN|nr:biotin/lipoyl-containing protein [Microbispora oryzae]MBP2708265.1 acetyl-CoA carboxylase, biotin carboxyl carrier protein [Microbispora oryzae]
MTDLVAELRLLREEVSSLVKTIPGPVASVSLRVGDCALEIAWERSGTAAAAPRPETRDEPDDLIDDGVRTVVAPLVGTFYVAPEPGAAPFVRPGDRVEAGQAVGIVEAMKLMNQVASEWSGEVVEVAVADGQPVEFEQVLVRVKADQS